MEKTAVNQCVKTTRVQHHLLHSTAK